jgi:hypothetical protein
MSIPVLSLLLLQRSFIPSNYLHLPLRQRLSVHHIHVSVSRQQLHRLFFILLLSSASFCSFLSASHHVFLPSQRSHVFAHHVPRRLRFVDPLGR